MRVRSVYTEKVFQAHPDDPLMEAARRMHEDVVGALVFLIEGTV